MIMVGSCQDNGMAAIFFQPGLLYSFLDEFLQKLQHPLKCRCTLGVIKAMFTKWRNSLQLLHAYKYSVLIYILINNYSVNT